MIQTFLRGNDYHRFHAPIDDVIVEGAHVKKGQQLGRFSYGGSTLCLLFQANDAIKYFIS